MMRRILLLLTVVALMVGMSVLPASAAPGEPPQVDPGAGPVFICVNPDTGVGTSLFARSLGDYKTSGFTDCTLYTLYF